MFISKDICPVPFDQQPLNEYTSLKKSWFFSWSIWAIDKYLQTIVKIASILFILFSPFILSSTSYNNSMSNIKFIVEDFIIVTICLIAILIRLYLGWSYVMKRLLSATVFYEESGWYDGQLWIKTAEIMTKDRLVGLYEINPFMNRLNYTLAVLIFGLMLEALIFYLL